MWMVYDRAALLLFPAPAANYIHRLHSNAPMHQTPVSIPSTRAPGGPRRGVVPAWCLCFKQMRVWGTRRFCFQIGGKRYI